MSFHFQNRVHLISKLNMEHLFQQFCSIFLPSQRKRTSCIQASIFLFFKWQSLAITFPIIIHILLFPQVHTSRKRTQLNANIRSRYLPFTPSDISTTYVFIAAPPLSFGRSIKNSNIPTKRGKLNGFVAFEENLQKVKSTADWRWVLI